MFKELYERIIVYIKNKYFSKALQKVISENRSDNNWDKVEVPYCLSKNEQTLAIVNNLGSFQSIEVYERELFKFIWVGSIILDERNFNRMRTIDSITINSKGDHIAILRKSHQCEVILFSLINGKWRHKKTFLSYIREKDNMFGQLTNIKYVEFCKHIDTKKEVLSIYMNGGVAIVHEFYRSKTKDLIAKGFF